MSLRGDFFSYLAQTSREPLGLEVIKAQGLKIIDNRGRKYIDLISGISVSNLGHHVPEIKAAIAKQLEDYTHLMVYGEFIQQSQVEYARLLIEHLPDSFQQVFFVNSGSEAVEGALKLSKRFTGRHEIVCFEGAYHGSTQGALSLISDETYTRPFRPLLPSIKKLRFNYIEDLSEISRQTAAVIIEPIQAEAGVRIATPTFLKALRERCNETETLLIFDEIQTGFGRTGTLFAFEQYGVVPDILLLGKALGGGLPLGAFIASRQIMEKLTFNPPLGHITTFGGHPLSCAAGLAAFKLILSKLPELKIKEKGLLFQYLIKQHPFIKDVRVSGLLIGVEFENERITRQMIHLLLEHRILTDWFLFSPNTLRIAPPLIIDSEMIIYVCNVLNVLVKHLEAYA
ncbi:MAG: aspartate aminotransferase family protein [Bacteroidales bacterium]|nr:aspartate aminotransferase family protein [Bacteroidales bacterium]